MSIHLIIKIMIKFILPIAVFIAIVYVISYFWNSSSTQGRKKIALGLVTAILLSLLATIYLITD